MLNSWLGFDAKMQQRWTTKEEFRNIAWLCGNGIRSMKAQMELRLERDTEGNKKSFHHCISIKRLNKGNEGLLLNGAHKSKHNTAILWNEKNRPRVSMRGNYLRFYMGKFTLDIRKMLFTERLVKHWNRLPRGVVESPSRKLFKRHIHVALMDMV